MAKFEVTFEDVGFTSDPGVAEAELTEAEAESLTAAAREEGTLPAHVLAVVRGYATPDDSVYPGGKDAEGDIKAFVSVTLLVEADGEEAASEPPERLLAALAEIMGGGRLDLERSWEAMDCTEAAAAPTCGGI